MYPGLMQACGRLESCWQADWMSASETNADYRWTQCGMPLLPSPLVQGLVKLQPINILSGDSLRPAFMR
jgi:hypothetical protein